jgi:hypothetical protein
MVYARTTAPAERARVRKISVQIRDEATEIKPRSFIPHVPTAVYVVSQDVRVDCSDLAMSTN